MFYPEASEDSSEDSNSNLCMLSRALGRSGVKVDCGEWQADDSGCAGAMRVRLVPRHKDKTTS
jgi:hypothetical protein